MKMKHLKRIEVLVAALFLTVALGCSPSKPAETEAGETAVAAPAAPEVQAAPAAPTAPAAPAAPAETTPAVAVSTTPAPAAPATGAVRYDALPTGSKMRMEGTSTLHDWWMESAIVGGFLEADAGFPATSAKATMQVFMPVRSFKSSGGKRMDTVMQEHMKESQFKRIEYTLVELKPKSTGSGSGPVAFEAIGALTIIGNTVTNSMPVTIEKMADGKLKIVGSTPLKMTDYKLPPPEINIPLLPNIKVGDDLKITFEWLLAQKAP